MAHDLFIDNDNDILAQKEEECFDYEALEKLNLEHPDEGKAHTYDWPDDFLQRLIGSMIHDDCFLEKGATLIKPQYFREDAHRMLCQIILDLRARHGVRPDITMLRAELNTKMGSNSHKEFYLAELGAVSDAFEPGVEKRDYFLERITEFAKVQALRAAYNKTIDLFRSNRSDKWDQIGSIIHDALGVGERDDAERAFWKIGDLEQDTPAIRHLIQDHMIAGGLTYLNADSGTGKTFLALDWSLCVASGKPYLGDYKVVQGPVIYIGQEGADDNKLRVKGWLQKHADWLDGHGLAVADLPFFYVPRDFDLRSPSDQQELLRLIREDAWKRNARRHRLGHGVQSTRWRK